MDMFFLKTDKWHRRLISKALLLVSFGDICLCYLKCLFVLLIWSDNHTFEAFCETTKIALLSFSFQKTGHSNRTFGRFTHGVFGFIDNRLLQERFYDNSSESVSHLMCGLCLKSRMHWFCFSPYNLKESAANLAISLWQKTWEKFKPEGTKRSWARIWFELVAPHRKLHWNFVWNDMKRTELQFKNCQLA